jgi:hypothetical protein
MTTRRTTLLLATLLLALMPGGIAFAEDKPATSDDAAMDYIRLLEAMLRDAGVEPPARPQALLDRSDVEEPQIVPASFATVVLETEVALINERGEKASNAIQHVRRWLDRDNVQRRVAAEDVIEAIAKWADLEMKKIESTSDPVAAFILADDAIHTLGQDALAKPFKAYMVEVQRDRSAYRDLESMAAYRRAFEDAKDLGLLGDWGLIDFTNASIRNTIKQLTTKLTLVTNRWPNTEAAQYAQTLLDDWADREARALAELPAWRYTWQLALIQTGTEVETSIRTYADGTVFIDEEQRPNYDPNRVLLKGTFQNTSDRSYRYTFVVGVTSAAWPNTPFNKLTKKQLMSYELVQTPLLSPGELHNWETTLSVNSIRNLHRGGIGFVEVHERRSRR